MWTDLAEHVTSLVAILSTCFVIIAALLALTRFLFWRLIRRIEIKTDQNSDYLLALIETCGGREANCLKMFVSQKDFEEWKEGRNGLWQAINHHRHDPEGKVTRL